MGDYYKDEQWMSEWGYVLLMPLLTTLFAMGLLILGYYLHVHLTGIQAQVSF